MLKEIKFKGGFFTEETKMELFNESKRLLLVYGKNGSGKSTISRAMQKAKGDEVGEIAYANLYDENGQVFSDIQSIHVFNEEYINSCVKIREDGLNSIVLLGELGNFEDRILDLKRRKEEEEKKNLQFKKNVEEYNNGENKKSPIYCKNKIIMGLSGDGHWAEREKIINEGKRNASVTERIFDLIVALTPSEKLTEVKKRYDTSIELLNQVRKNKVEQIKDTVKLQIPYNENLLQNLLMQKVESPVLTDREKYLLQLIDMGKLEQINEMKLIFSQEKTKKCPFCLQDITEDRKQELITSIQRILSKEVEHHKEKLSGCMIQDINIDFTGMEDLNSQNYIKCKDAIGDINKEISNIREIILEKINHPYTPIDNFKSNLQEKIQQYESVRMKLQEEIDAYNNAAKEIATIEKNLMADNKIIAYYEVQRDIELWRQALDEQKEAKNILEKSDKIIKDFSEKLNALESQKKNIKIAENLINKSLRYVFFSKNRLEIKPENGKYVLYAYGKPVRPNNVSVGERNIIALCYFFVELIMNQDVKDGYKKKLILVIDDPVSSFDFENKVGIMSFLRSKVSEILKSNQESQIIIMTHDIQCFYDMHKIGEDIKDEVPNEKQTYSCMELKDKKIIQFAVKKRNEYSELFKIVYDYACGITINEELTVGNSMRRVLEAFSTFVYKKGIAQISCDESILQTIKDKDYIDYFKNLMYRLVLNGDSHMEERANGMEVMDYTDILSDEERQRTAQEVICFIYLLNAEHVLAHLQGKKDVEKNIHKWCENIKGFYKIDEDNAN